MRVAIIHDWLVEFAGAERVLKELVTLYPKAVLHTLIDFLPSESRSFLKETEIKTSFIQRLPWAKKRYRSYLPLMPLAIEAFDLSSYDLIISSHHSMAKGVIVGPDQIHICYCHSPVRYAWDLQHEYFNQAGIGWGLKGMFAHYMLHKIRIWDRQTAGVDHFISVSSFIQKRIHRVYRRESAVIHPPVDIDAFELKKNKEDFYFTASRMVPYKRIDLIVEAFRLMPDKRLVVIGSGPQYKKLRRRAPSNVSFLGFQSDAILKDYLKRARAFIFAAKEDFGIVPLEAQACGTPVIGFGRGGLLDSIIPGETGLFFSEQTVASLSEAVQLFEEQSFCPIACRENAERFSVSRFQREIRQFVEEALLDRGACTKA